MHTLDPNANLANVAPPVSDGLGKEVVTRLDTSIDTAQYFYTDSNGREVLQRK